MVLLRGNHCTLVINIASTEISTYVQVRLSTQVLFSPQATTLTVQFFWPSIVGKECKNKISEWPDDQKVEPNTLVECWKLKGFQSYVLIFSTQVG